MTKQVARPALAALLVALLAGTGVQPAFALEPAVSPDVTLTLGTNNKTASKSDVAVHGPSGTVGLVPLGSLPADSNLSGYERLANGNELLCFDTTVELPGPLTVQPGDVVRRSGSTYTIEMAAAANGVPPGAYCDALTVDSTGKLVLSFDVSVVLPPSSLAVDDEDLVRRNGASNWELYLDGSGLGIPSELDVDGAQQLANGDIDLSLDGSGQVFGPVNFDDEDVLEWDFDGMSWSLAFDGSVRDPDWAAADVDALPEPSAPTLLLVGSLGLIGIAQSADSIRRRRSYRRSNR